MYLRMGDEAEARRVFSEIVEFAPYDALSRRRLGDLYRAHGWFEDAYRQYQTLASIRPDDPAASLLLAQAAAGAGRVDEALRLEQRLMETAEPGASRGLSRVALLWSSVRLGKLRQAARAAGDAERLESLGARMRRSGVLREAGAMRVSLTWSHPDAGLSLWVSHPGLGLTRPTDIAPEYGIEAFDVAEAETGRYRVEVRRAGRPRDLRTPVEAELVVVWNEGGADEQVEVRRLRFEGDAERALAWTIDGRTLAEASPQIEQARRAR
jgi:Ca-activated chloride channel family protein